MIVPNIVTHACRDPHHLGVWLCCGARAATPRLIHCASKPAPLLVLDISHRHPTVQQNHFFPPIDFYLVLICFFRLPARFPPTPPTPLIAALTRPFFA